MLLKFLLALLAWMLLGLAALLTSCASSSPAAPPTAGPLIPPLPAEAKQTASPTHSANALIDIERWRKSLTRPSAQASPASGPTNH